MLFTRLGRPGREEGGGSINGFGESQEGDVSAAALEKAYEGAHLGRGGGTVGCANMVIAKA